MEVHIYKLSIVVVGIDTIVGNTINNVTIDLTLLRKIIEESAVTAKAWPTAVRVSRRQASKFSKTTTPACGAATWRPWSTFSYETSTTSSDLFCKEETRASLICCRSIYAARAHTHTKTVMLTTAVLAYSLNCVSKASPTEAAKV